MKPLFTYFLLLFITVANAQKPEVKRLRILHYQVPCMGEGIQLCYLVEQKSGEIAYFYSPIEGFDYKWGFNYDILLEQIKIGNPKADNSSIAYRLKKVLKKEKIVFGVRFELPLVINGNSIIDKTQGKCLYFGLIPIDTLGEACAVLAKAKVGVFEHVDGGIRFVKVSQ